LAIFKPADKMHQQQIDLAAKVSIIVIASKGYDGTHTKKY
jgi:hypothetical protein